MPSPISLLNLKHQGGAVDDFTADDRTVVSDTGFFVAVPFWVVNAGLSPRAQSLYLVLGTYADFDTSIVGAVRRKTLANRLDASVATVDRATKELVEAGALIVEEQYDERGDRTSNRYILLRVRGGRPRSEVTGGPESDAPVQELTTVRENEETAVAVPSQVGPPKAVRVGGRDLPFDALMEVTGIQSGSPRMKEIPVALNGSRTQIGIREQAWAEWGFAELGLGHVEDWESSLADRIRDRAKLWRRKMPGATLTPTALAKWWTDLPGLPEARDGRSGSGQDALAIADQAVRDARQRERQ